MPNNYRIYRIDSANHVLDVELVTAADDDAAIAAARAMKIPGKREVWQGERLVATVHVKTKGKPSEAYWL